MSYRAQLLVTAGFIAAAASASAETRIRIADDALAGLNPGCQELVAIYNADELPAGAPPATEAVDVINADDDAACVTYAQDMGADTMAADTMEEGTLAPVADETETADMVETDEATETEMTDTAETDTMEVDATDVEETAETETTDVETTEVEETAETDALEVEETDTAEMTEAEMTETETEEVSETEVEQVTEEVEITQNATIEGQAVVTVPEPEVDVEMDPAEITVRQMQPDVIVTEGQTTIEVVQSQPTVNVEIPQIIVTVEVPAPTIYVRRDDPTVDLALSDPMIEVQQSEPRVTVRQGQPELVVDLGVDSETGDVDATDEEVETADSIDTTVGDDATVVASEDIGTGIPDPIINFVEPEDTMEVSVAQNEPQITYESAEPNVSVNFAAEPTIEIVTTGEPTVTFETGEEREARIAGTDAADMTEGDEMAEGDDAMAEEADDAMVEEADGAAVEEANAEMTAGTYTVDDILEMDVITADGENLGEPETLIDRAGETQLIVSSGGFLGLGENQVAVPLSRVTVVDGELVLENLTEEEIEAAADIDYERDSELDGEMSVSLN